MVVDVAFGFPLRLRFNFVDAGIAACRGEVTDGSFISALSAGSRHGEEEGELIDWVELVMIVDGLDKAASDAGNTYFLRFKPLVSVRGDDKI